MKLSDLLIDIGRPIAYYPRLARVCGGVSGAVLLCQFLYWADKRKEPDGWIYKSQVDIELETGLTPKEQRHARDQLGPMLEARYDRLTHRQFYRVNTTALDQCYEDTWSRGSRLPNVTSRSDERSLPEVTFPEVGKWTFGSSGNGLSIRTQRVLTETTKAEETKTSALRLLEPSSERLLEPTPEAHPFAAFWTAYPKKVDKIRAERIWSKTSVADRTAIMAALPAYLLYCKEDERPLRDPCTFLNPEARFWLTDFASIPRRQAPTGRSGHKPYRDHDHWAAARDQPGVWEERGTDG